MFTVGQKVRIKSSVTDFESAMLKDVCTGIFHLLEELPANTVYTVVGFSPFSNNPLLEADGYRHDNYSYLSSHKLQPYVFTPISHRKLKDTYGI